MKTILLVLIIFSSFAFSSEIEDKFNWKERATSIDYLGTVVNNDKIICYGTNGSYVYSTDKGKHWDQSKIPGIDVIINLENVDGKLLGFTLDCHTLKSTDNGTTWEINQIDKLDSIFYVIYNDGYFFVRDKNSINVIDKNFNIISTYKDQILRYTTGKFSLKVLEGFKLIVKEDNIFFNSTSNKLLSINKADFIKNKLTINQISICDSCIHGINIISYGNNLLLSIYMNNPSNYKTTLFYLYNLKNKTLRELTKEEANIKNATYFELGYLIYQLKDITSYLYPFDYSQFQLSKYNVKDDTNQVIGKTPIIPLNLHFDSKFLSQIDDSTLILVSSSKTILISYNLGQTWETISLVNSIHPIVVYSDSLELYKDGIFNSFISKNEGVTCKPNEYDYLDKKYKSLDNNLSIGYDLIFNLDSNNKIFFINTQSSSNVNNVFMSNDNCKTYTAKSIKEFQNGLGNTNHVYLNRINNNMYDIYNTTYKNKNYFVFSKLDTNMNFISSQTDSVNYVYSALFKNQNEGFAISNFYDSLGISLVTLKRNSIDNKWERRAKQYVKFDKIDIYELGNSKDSVLIVCKKINGGEKLTTIFIYDNTNETFDKIYENTANEEPKFLLLFTNKMFLVGNNFFMEFGNTNNYKSLKKYNVPDESDWKWALQSRDAKFYLVNYGSSTKENNVYKISLNPNSSIEKTEDQTYFYSYPPFPTPSMNQVKSLIYWDMSYNIDDSDIGVYDIYGNKIANRDKISINKLNSYSGYLTWDCSGASTGVYMIQIKHGTNTHNIRAMVVR